MRQFPGAVCRPLAVEFDLVMRGSAVDAVADGAAAAGIDCTTAVRDGVPYRAILEYAAETPVDLVVIGTHGRSGRDKLANLGSVTERVVENTETPTLVIRIDEREA